MPYEKLHLKNNWRILGVWDTGLRR